MSIFFKADKVIENPEQTATIMDVLAIVTGISLTLHLVLWIASGYSINPLTGVAALLSKDDAITYIKEKVDEAAADAVTS